MQDVFFLAGGDGGGGVVFHFLDPLGGLGGSRLDRSEFQSLPWLDILE